MKIETKYDIGDIVDITPHGERHRIAVGKIEYITVYKSGPVDYAVYFWRDGMLEKADVDASVLEPHVLELGKAPRNGGLEPRGCQKGT